LANAKIEIDGKLCGYMPKAPLKKSTWYTIKCATPIVGKVIKVTSAHPNYFHFAEIKAYGEKVGANG
jgi:hypothetical protein